MQKLACTFSPFGLLQIWELFAVKFLYDTTAAGLVYVLVIFFLLTICIGAQRAPLDLRPAA